MKLLLKSRAYNNSENVDGITFTYNAKAESLIWSNDGRKLQYLVIITARNIMASTCGPCIGSSGEYGRKNLSRGYL